MSYLMDNYSRFNVTFSYGLGEYLYDTEGRKYIDFASGISVTNLGHNFPAVTNAIKSQAEKLLHTSNLYNIDIQEVLAEKISKNSFNGRVFFCNSGAEANEAAIKLARLYGNTIHNGKRYKIISMYNSFHGRTYGSMGATAQGKIQKGFHPMPGYNHYVPFNDIDALKSVLSLGDTAGILLELFQGEGGVISVDCEYIKEVRKICDKEDILLIIDEVQTGYGRTGELFAYKLFDIEPDIMTVSKAVCNGVPMGACIAKEKAAKLFTAGTHGSTFGGNHLACAAGIAVIDEMTKKDFLINVRKKGNILRNYLKERLDSRCEIKGQGLLTGIKTPYEPRDVALKCLEKGLLVVTAGNNSVRLYPPLNINDDALIKGCEIFTSVISELR